MQENVCVCVCVCVCMCMCVCVYVCMCVCVESDVWVSVSCVVWESVLWGGSEAYGDRMGVLESLRVCAKAYQHSCNAP